MGRSDPEKISSGRGISERLRCQLHDFFGIDLRTLALVRIVAAILVLWNLAILAPDVAAFYSDAGVFPRSLWHEHSTNPFAFSLHGISGAVWWQYVLFGVHGLAALCLLVGYKTRLASVVTWALLLSLYLRNPTVLHGADQLLGLFLLWGSLTPWGARFSIDGAVGADADTPQRVTSFATAGLLLQMPLAYYSSAIHKLDDPTWGPEFSAVFYSMAPGIVTPIGQHIAQIQPYEATQLATLFAMFIELLAPILIFCPLLIFCDGPRRRRWLGRLRLLSIAALTMLQLGILLTLSIGLFPLISTLGLLPALPASVWKWSATNRIMQRLGGWTRKPFSRVREALDASSLLGVQRNYRVRPTRVGAILAALLLTSTLVGGMDSVYERNTSNHFVPDTILKVQYALRIQQHWQMFVHPRTWSAYFVIEGKRSDGLSIDLYDGGPINTHRAQEPTWYPPEAQRSSEFYHNYRWRIYMRSIGNLSMRKIRQGYARYICRTWNEANSDDDRLHGLGIYGVLQSGDRLHQPLSDGERVLLGAYICGVDEDVQEVTKAQNLVTLGIAPEGMVEIATDPL